MLLQLLDICIARNNNIGDITRMMRTHAISVIPPSPPPAAEFPTRGPAEARLGNESAPIRVQKRAWLGTMLLWAMYTSREFWNLCYYGIPTGAGVMSGMMRNRRDVLGAPLFFTILFAGWTWSSCQPGSVAEFRGQLRTNAKSMMMLISTI